VARGTRIFGVNNMFEEIRKVLGIPKNEIGKQTITRNVNDVTISVSEGLSETRQITVTNWNPELAFDLFKRVRDELRENPRESTL